jgi:hypothetical protein
MQDLFLTNLGAFGGGCIFSRRGLVICTVLGIIRAVNKKNVWLAAANRGVCLGLAARIDAAETERGLRRFPSAGGRSRPGFLQVEAMKLMETPESADVEMRNPTLDAGWGTGGSEPIT